VGARQETQKQRVGATKECKRIGAHSLQFAQQSLDVAVRVLR